MTGGKDGALSFQIMNRAQLGDGDGNDMETFGLFDLTGVADFSIERRLVLYGSEHQCSVINMQQVSLEKIATFGSEDDFLAWWEEQHRANSYYWRGVWYLVTIIAGSLVPDVVKLSVKRKGASWEKVFPVTDVPGCLRYDIPEQPKNGRRLAC